MWHDLINNGISSHKSNNHRPSSAQELTNYLTTNNNKFEALVYCQRTGTPDIFKELLSTGILALRVTKHLISKQCKIFKNRLPNGTPRMYVRHQWIEGFKKANDFLKDQKLLAVPFDKGCGFCVMKQTTYSDKLNEIMSSSQFEPRNGESDDLTIRTEKLINSSLHQLMNQGKISGKIYQRLRTTGLQPARLYGLAKKHKIGTPLWPVQSIPGSSYENINNFLSPFFGKLPGANIETPEQL